MLRLDWNILFNIINILILYFLLKRFLFKPVNAILEKRQQEADSIFAQANEKESQAQECKSQYEALLGEAKDEKEKIVAEARKEASAEYTRIVNEAKDKAGDIVEKAQEDAKKEKNAILEQADVAVRDIVLTAAAKMTGVAEGQETDHALYDRFLEKVNGQEQK